jgi:hypothetical protein
MASETVSERRIVLSADPSLTVHANELLTQELRAVIGSDEVQVPTSAPHHETERHGAHSVLLTMIANVRLGAVIVSCTAVAVGGVVAMVTHSLWALFLALVVHAICTTMVSTTIWRSMSQMEHLAPEVAARLAAEGVADPDRVFAELLQDYGRAPTSAPA